MSGKVTSLAKTAKKGVAQNAGKTRQDCRWFEPALVELEKLYPSKFAVNMRLHVNRDERVIERWKSRDTAPDGAALAELIASQIGDLIVLALNNKSTHQWVAEFRTQLEMAALDREQERINTRRAELQRGRPA